MGKGAGSQWGLEGLRLCPQDTDLVQRSHELLLGRWEVHCQSGPQGLAWSHEADGPGVVFPRDSAPSLRDLIPRPQILASSKRLTEVECISLG